MLLTFLKMAITYQEMFSYKTSYLTWKCTVIVLNFQVKYIGDILRFVTEHFYAGYRIYPRNDAFP